MMGRILWKGMKTVDLCIAQDLSSIKYFKKICLYEYYCLEKMEINRNSEP